MQILPLGTNGFFPTFNRQTACYAISLPETLIILDSGSGLFRLAEPKGRRLLEKSENIHLYLSHYHLDHTFGFYSAFRLLKDKKVTVFAETERKVFADLAKEYFPIDFDREYANFRWQKLNIGENKIGDYLVKVRKQYHRGAGSLAFRFIFNGGKQLVYATDNEPNRDLIKFVNKVDLLLQEHYQSGEEILKRPGVSLVDHFDGNHTTTAGAAIIAKEGKAGKLALIHHFPFYDDKKLEELLAVSKRLFPQTVLAQDLQEITF